MCTLLLINRLQSLPLASTWDECCFCVFTLLFAYFRSSFIVVDYISLVRLCRCSYSKYDCLEFVWQMSVLFQTFQEYGTSTMTIWIPFVLWIYCESQNHRKMNAECIFWGTFYKFIVSTTCPFIINHLSAFFKEDFSSFSQ